MNSTKYMPNQNPQTFRELCILAAEMRALQRVYFSRGGVEALQAARKAEKHFDNCYNRLINGTDQKELGL